MPNLKEFQRAAVERIVASLKDPNGKGRYLVADEVGLGKTLITQGVIREMAARKPKFVVVYLCSNLEIAAQNAEKLCAGSGSSVPVTKRLTLFPIRENKRESSKLSVYSFSPGTSLRMGRSTGVIEERRLIMYLLTRYRGEELGITWIRYFRCTAGNTWKQKAAPRRLRDDFRGDIDRNFIGKWNELFKSANVELREDPNQGGSAKTVKFNLSGSLKAIVQEWADNKNADWAKFNQRVVIGKLRELLAVAALEDLSPDLIVMDEFQRFSDVLTNSACSGTLEHQLLTKKNAKALILSATPYKMYATRAEEGERSHHDEFLKTYAFLRGEPFDRESPSIKSLQQKLDGFRKGLEQITPERAVDSELLRRKKEIEEDLRQVMCRTERSRYIEGARKGVVEVPLDGVAKEIPEEQELIQYVQLRRFLLADRKRARKYGRTIMDFWKSAPSLLSFMDGHYKLISRLRDDKKTKVPSHLLLEESKTKNSLSDSWGQNLKSRKLFDVLFGRKEEKSSSSPEDNKSSRHVDSWKYLWIKPSYTYYEDDFYSEFQPKKVLVFSHWFFVPKTVAFLTSRYAEKLIGFNKEEFQSSPLTFQENLISIFTVAFPSYVLAEQVDVLGLASSTELPTRAKLEEQVEQQVKELLTAAGFDYVEDGPLATDWELISRLEYDFWQSRSQDDARRFLDELNWSGIRLDGQRKSTPFESCRKQYSKWYEQSLKGRADRLTFNSTNVKRIASIALYSPTTCILRSVLRLRSQLIPRNAESNITEFDLFGYVARIGINQVRNYFNKPISQAIVTRAVGDAKGTRYVDRVLKYCGLAHFQAMIDEFVVMASGNYADDPDGSKAERLINHTGDVFAMQSGTPQINRSVNGRIKPGKTVKGVNTHFALAFGDDAQVDSDTGEVYKSRKSDIRNSFNSPFWPFVLATTSVGQEGLDFHLYCKDIVHWNLPSNPVDLEQREGRLNRFNCLAIRQMIAKDFPIEDLSHYRLQAKSGENRGLPWNWVFDEIEKQHFDAQSFKQGLYPHWIYVPRDEHQDPEVIRRHLMFYANSRDVERYRKLKQDLSLYRLVFGQPRQQDMIERIRENLGESIDESILNEFLPIYMINLSPFSADHVWETSVEKAGEILRQPGRTNEFLEHVNKFLDADQNATALAHVRPKIDDLYNYVTQERPEHLRSLAAAALYYLVNPYDDVYDFFHEIGFEDDIERIEQVHLQLVAR